MTYRICISKGWPRTRGPLLPTVQSRQLETGHPEHRPSRCSRYYSRCERVGCRTSIVTMRCCCETPSQPADFDVPPQDDNAGRQTHRVNSIPTPQRRRSYSKSCQVRPRVDQHWQLFLSDRVGRGHSIMYRISQGSDDNGRGCAVHPSSLVVSFVGGGPSHG
jgi:hypothetical protein